VRVINSKDETAAKVRVIIESKRDAADGSKEIFGTIGVSGNVIDASWQALVDAYEYHLIHEEEARASATNEPAAVAAVR
jgi:2-isopropylmalate synthase